LFILSILLFIYSAYKVGKYKDYILPSQLKILLASTHFTSHAAGTVVSDLRFQHGAKTKEGAHSRNPLTHPLTTGQSM